MWKLFAVPAAVAVLTCAPSSAQSTDAVALEVNPLVEEMMRGTGDGGGQTVQLSGYVGPSTADTVRLYENLALSGYVEIPRSAVVSVVRDGDARTGPVRLSVSGATVVVSARRHAARDTTSARRIATAHALQTAGDGIQPDHCALPCGLCGLLPGSGTCGGCGLCLLTQ